MRPWLKLLCYLFCFASVVSLNWRWWVSSLTLLFFLCDDSECTDWCGNWFCFNNKSFTLLIPPPAFEHPHIFSSVCHVVILTTQKKRFFQSFWFVASLIKRWNHHRFFLFFYIIVYRRKNLIFFLFCTYSLHSHAKWVTKIEKMM